MSRGMLEYRGHSTIIEYGFGWVHGEKMYQMNAPETGNLTLNNPPTEPVHQCFDNTTTTTGVLVLTFDNTAATGYFATAREVKLDLRSGYSTGRVHTQPGGYSTRLAAIGQSGLQPAPQHDQHNGERQVARSSVNGKAVFTIGVPVVIGAAVAGPAVAGWMAARGGCCSCSSDEEKNQAFILG